MYRKFEARYQYHALAPALLLALIGSLALGSAVFTRSRWGARIAAILLAFAAVRPDHSLATVLRQYGPVSEPFADEKVAPDHQGTGRFVLAHARPGEWIAAEDMLQQAVYVGHVDVWLRPIKDAASFVRHDPEGGPPRDIYVGSRQVEDLQALVELAKGNGRRTVWLITSGESEALPLWFRTPSTDATLRSWRPLAWHAGRDGMSWVYKLVDGEPVPPPAGPAS
jgi:hypothetical protein